MKIRPVANGSKRRACVALPGGMLLLLLILTACSSREDAGTGTSARNDTGLIGTAYAQTESHPRGADTEDLYLSRQNAITRAVSRVSPAVVGINVTQVKTFARQTPLSMLFPELYRERSYFQKIQSLGSGFIISQDGYVITNEHVVEDAVEIVVTLPDGRHLDAKIVGADRDTDIALLKLEGDDYPYIEFGHSDDLIVGEWVIALGNPFGLVELNNQPTVTVGVISAIDRDWGRTSRGALYLDMIQTDAAINHGNSGGPLVNTLGQAIGMNTFIFTGSQYEEGSVGIGFAIPIDRIRQVVDELKTKGQINRNFWLGIDQAIDLNRRIIRALDLKVEKGALITDIEPGSPARRSGLQEYDVVVAINGIPVDSRQKFIETIRNQDLKVGTVLTFTVNRQGRELNIDVKLEPNPRRR